MRPFGLIAAAAVFGLIALAQLVRLVLGWPIVVNGVGIPLWVSTIAFLVATWLAFLVWREARR